MDSAAKESPLGHVEVLQARDSKPRPTVNCTERKVPRSKHNNKGPRGRPNLNARHIEALTKTVKDGVSRIQWKGRPQLLMPRGVG